MARSLYKEDLQVEIVVHSVWSVNWLLVGFGASVQLFVALWASEEFGSGALG